MLHQHDIDNLRDEAYDIVVATVLFAYEDAQELCAADSWALTQLINQEHRRLMRNYEKSISQWEAEAE